MKIRRFRPDDPERRPGMIPPATPSEPQGPAPAEPAMRDGPPSGSPGKSAPPLPDHVDPIGQILLSQGAITQEQLVQALAVQRRSGGQLGRVLVKMGVMTEAQLARALVRQWGQPPAGEATRSGGVTGDSKQVGPTPVGNTGRPAPGDGPANSSWSPRPISGGPMPTSPVDPQAQRNAEPAAPPAQEGPSSHPLGDSAPAAPGRVDPIGQILLAQGAITQEQLVQALEMQRQTGGQLSRVLVKMGLMTEGQLARALVRQWGRPSAGETTRGGGVTGDSMPAAGQIPAGPAAPSAAHWNPEPPAPRTGSFPKPSGDSPRAEPAQVDPIGQILLAQGTITEEELEQALEIQRQSGGQLSRVLVEMGVVTEGQMARTLARQAGRPSGGERTHAGGVTGDAVRFAGAIPPGRGAPPTPEGSDLAGPRVLEEPPTAPATTIGVGTAASAQQNSAGPFSRDGSPSDDSRKGDISKMPRVDPIGQILHAQGIVTQEQLRQALETQRQNGGQLSRILVKMGVVSEAQVARALANQWGRRTTADRVEPPVSPAAGPTQPTAPIRPAVGPAQPAPREADPIRPTTPRDGTPARPAGPLPRREVVVPRQGHAADAVSKSDSGKTSRIDTIGQILLAQGAITEEQLKQALEIQRQTGGRLGRVLVETGLVSEGQLARGLAQQWGRPFTDLGTRKVSAEVARMIPTYLAQRHGVMPLERKKNHLVVAMSDPANVVAIDDIRLLTGLDVEIVIASADDIARVQSDLYGVALDVEELLKQSATEPEIAEDTSRTEEMSVERLQTMVEEAPIVRVVNQIIAQAIQAGASDIHLEPHRKEVKVRFRIDGILQDIMSPPKAVQPALISRVKILASMDIAERRLPQDGHINVRIEGKEFDLRVSTLPTVLGEKVVIRILDQSSTRVSLSKIGLSGALLVQWEELIGKPYGMIIVTGPTGSGKTTTLYTSLARINTPDLNIVSVEDPVEYQMPRVNQVQVNVKAGLTFASGLRSILRQDPDIVLIGEVRDRETAEIAIQASMTGHLVLTTLHTNDAPGAVTRLRDMGIEPFLVTSSLLGVMAQRLVRVICAHCKESYVPPSDALHRLGLDPQEHKDVTLFRGKGCDHCRMTGYKGRIGVFELMVMNEELRSRVLGGSSIDDLRQAAQMNGMRTLGADGVQKVLEGITTFEELLRVVFVNEGSDGRRSPEMPSVKA